ncbi:MAG TPA: DUF1292 domain-containing protein [Halanaerobiaceae bacterium]|nr:DUF1292 domain-containing protein [Bacillota bacterium]HHU92834.1 DUF1292 domain-containing protein [Halanaerobiaceae bacterium]HOA40683.1 DUF1292 domain-containing protein [Halanaerobiales bacterium]HPZ63428.1 DUF1292 domain-containing protein [Halanaerobiales bacterium]HQD04665.1 DUF1292 domain-containing protein [Halanaerobiales bacterium]
MANEGTFWIDEEEGLLIIRDMDGVEDQFVIEDELFIDDNRYLILIPEESIDDAEAEAFVLKIINDQDEEVLTVIDDEEEFQMVKENYESLP